MSDSTDIFVNPTNADILKVLAAMQRQIETVLRKQDEHATAFVMNDLGKPDLDGHRLYHFRSIKSKEQMDSYKTGMTKTLVDWVVKGVLFLVVAGFIAVLSAKFGISK